jgi:tetratricopeptide (TPR) repeat protein
MAKEEAEIKELSKKLAQNPDSLVFAPLADAYRRMGKLDEAIEICRKGLEHNPTYTTARTILGRVYFEKEMLDEAISEFRKIEAADSNNTMAHSMLGQIFMRKGMYSEAIGEHQKVLALNPDDSVAQSLLEEALEKAKQIPGTQKGNSDEVSSGKAEEKAAAELKVAPSKEQLATITVAEIYLKKGAYDEAIEVFEEILQADPENPIAKQKLKEIVALKEGDRKSVV